MTTRRLLAVLALLVGAALPARAGVVTCTNVIDLIPGNTYMVAGFIQPSSSYATGGETFSASNSLADVGNCLCHSPNRKPLVVLVEGQKGGYLYDFDHVNNKLRILYPVAIANAAGGNAVSATAPAGGVSNLQAVSGAPAGSSGGELINGFTGLNSATFTVRYIALCS